ncbi:MAG: organic solute transporter Ostalpha-domain-containing protein [Monoraphidium minutum]|nr:MAG: organic solute transporter Ostalpha-domain-containing protein [Monoraphidium minutum]
MEAWPFRRVFRVGWWILCTATLLALPLTIWEFKNQGFSPHYQAWFVAGIFVIMTIPISVYEVAMHTEYYTRPRLQRHVIRILWMVPIYSIDAWLALRFKDARLYLDPVRECYEAYVIYNFYAYLMNFLEDELGCVDEYLSLKAPIPHLWPFSKCVTPWKMGADYLWQTKKGVANYVILRPLCTAIALITDHFGEYGQGELRPNKAYPFLAFATNCSQMWALYCLVMFYHAFKDELHPIRPLAKFICIKAVVFLTFWQGLTLNILVATGAIRVNEQFTTYTAADVAEGLQARPFDCFPALALLGLARFALRPLCLFRHASPSRHPSEPRLRPSTHSLEYLHPLPNIRPQGLPDLHRDVPSGAGARLRLPAQGLHGRQHPDQGIPHQRALHV